ncbi:AraC family transcriptional regulator [Halioglobus maricola]|uniref:AraC family transcriptional regulator n=1 Tax=Halioglobus maricola TaxID=2601894 RepID=A0A5P9NNN8_9GAMM|nr:AraC family transcriptional regulator [Halioglobus maricola]QFU77402.1 AraC family transcriptional regulator [Halioglobus maricola]
MVTTVSEKLHLPMVRLNLAKPFLDAALAAGADVEKELRVHCLTVDSFGDNEHFVTAPTMYDVVESLAELTCDPYCGVTLGEALDPLNWSPLAEAARNASSVGDLLLRFSIDAYKDANSVEFKLETRGVRSTFTENRLTDGGRIPRHNDGFGAAYVLSILRTALGSNWSGNEVLVQVCDPGIFPLSYADIKVATTDTNGFSVSFPSAWLLLEPQLRATGKAASPPVTRNSAPEDTLPTLRYILEQHIHEPGLDAEHVAHLCGISKRTLVRRLAELDTSLKQELDQLRRDQAQCMLANGSNSIAHIGDRLGYSDPTVFTRAFKRWTGVTPREFRDANQRDSTQR